MFFHTPQRLFLKSTTLASATMPADLRRNSEPEYSTTGSAQLRNSFFAVHFDVKTGKFNVWHKDKLLILNGSITVALADKTRRSSDPELARTVKVAEGRERQLVAQCFDPRRQIEFQITFTLTTEETLALAVICRNVGKETLNVRTLHPVNAALTDSAAFLWGGKTSVSSNPPVRLVDSESAKSWWATAFYAGSENENCLITWTSERDVERGIHVKSSQSAKTSGFYEARTLIAEAKFTPDFVLSPQAAVSSGKLVFTVTRS